MHCKEVLSPFQVRDVEHSSIDTNCPDSVFTSLECGNNLPRERHVFLGRRKLLVDERYLVGVNPRLDR